jgi:hypothetical protein
VISCIIIHCRHGANLHNEISIRICDILGEYVYDDMDPGGWFFSFALALLNVIDRSLVGHVHNLSPNELSVGPQLFNDVVWDKLSRKKVSDCDISRPCGYDIGEYSRQYQRRQRRHQYQSFLSLFLNSIF